MYFHGKFSSIVLVSVIHNKMTIINLSFILVYSTLKLYVNLFFIDKADKRARIEKESRQEQERMVRFYW